VTRYLYERPAGEAQPGDVDLMRFVLEIDDDENVFRPGREEWPERRTVAHALSSKIERAPWLPQKNASE